MAFKKITIFLFFYSTILLAKSTTISGFVFDESNGETLIGANIYFDEIAFGAITNSAGYYVVSGLEAGSYTLRCSYIGFKDYKKEVTLKDGQNLKLMIKLKADLMLTEEVVVSADSVRTSVKLFRKAISKINITPMEMKTMPAVAETDLLRTLQSMPGILPISDYSSEIYVRGGSSDQNLFLVDGADVYNPEHAFGLFSTFNTDAIKDIEIYKGGFPAEYGGRLSAVIDVTNLDGNRNEFEGTAEVSLLSAKSTIQMPIGNFGSISASYRRTYLGETAKLFYDDIPDYYFYDGHIKAFFDINENNNLTVSFYSGEDFLDYSFSEGTEDAPTLSYDWGNKTGSVRWTHIFTPKLFSNFWVTASRFNSKFNITQINVEELNNLTDIGVKGQLEYALGKTLSSKFGFEYKDLRINYNQDSPSGVIDVKRHRDYLTSYFALNWVPTPNWEIEPGLRYNYFKTKEKFSDFAPRFSAKYRLTETINLKASSGVFYQYLQKIRRPFIADIWSTSDENYDPSKSVHFILGFQKEVANNLSLEIEGYYKTYENLYSFKNYILDYPASYYDNQNRPVYTETKGLFDRGDGNSLGLEFLLRKRYGSLNGWLAYSLANTKYKLDGINQDKSYHPRHDRTHTFNAVMNVDIKNAIREMRGMAVKDDKSRWTIGVNFIYSSGQPITFPSSTYYGISVPDQDDEDLFLYPSEINRYRLPSYIRLDLSFTYEHKFKHFTMSPYFQGFNIGQRENVWFIQYETEQTDDQIVQKVEKFNMLPFLPSLGIKFTF